MLLHDHSSREVAFKHLQICVKLEVQRDAEILIPRHILRSLEAQTWNRPQPGPPERTQSYQSSAFQSLVRGLTNCQNYLRSRPRHWLASGAVRLNVYVAPSNEVLDDDRLLIEELAGDLRNVVRVDRRIWYGCLVERHGCFNLCDRDTCAIYDERVADGSKEGVCTTVDCVCTGGRLIYLNTLPVQSLRFVVVGLYGKAAI